MLQLRVGHTDPLALGAPFNTGNFDLDPIAGGLRGKITSSATGLPLAGITVSLYQRVESGVFVSSTVTSYRGNYFFSSLPAGTYVVFTSNSLGYRNEIYNDIPCTGACSSATAASSGQAINLTSTAWTSGIDFALDARTSAPAAPTNFRVVMTGTTGVFSWTAPGSNTTGAPTSYVIDAGFSPGSIAISIPAGTGTSFSIPGIPPGTFYVRVRAVNSFGSSPPSNELTLGMSAVGVALPETPTNLQAFMLDGLLTMTWLQPARGGPATGYIVEAGSASGLTNIGTVPAPGRSLTFPGVPTGFYFLGSAPPTRAGTSSPSAEVMIVVGGVAAPPPAPNFTSHTVSGSTVTLNWTPELAARQRPVTSSKPGRRQGSRNWPSPTPAARRRRSASRACRRGPTTSGSVRRMHRGRAWCRTSGQSSSSNPARPGTGSVPGPPRPPVVPPPDQPKRSGDCPVNEADARLSPGDSPLLRPPGGAVWRWR